MSEELTAGPAELRRAVCKDLTKVVRKSRLGEALDPKAFFMLLNANYDVLYRDDLFDLTMVWKALAEQHSPEDLAGLFIRFEEALQKRGLQVIMPPQVAGLTQEQQQMHLNAFEGGTDEVEAEVTEITEELEMMEDGNILTPPILELNTNDLRPFVSDELRRAVVNHVIYSVKSSPVGARVDGGQFAYLVDSNFPTLCDGKTFSFDPILQGLRDLGDVSDRDLYLTTVLLKRALDEYGMTVEHAPLDVSDEEGADIVEAFRLAREQAKREAKLALTHTADTPAPPPTTTVDTPRTETRREKLRELGLGTRDSRTARRIRIAVMTVVLIAVAVPAYLFRPSRSLSTEPYATTIPLVEAHLKGGTFIGQVDEPNWWPLSLEEREQRLQAFETLIQTQGFAPDLKIRDDDGRIVITSIGNGRIRGAPLLMKGRADGTLIAPPDYSKVAGAQAPKEAQEPEESDEPEPPQDP